MLRANIFCPVKGFVLCLLLLEAENGLTQSPWTQSKAGFYVQVAWQGIPAYKQVFDGFDVTDLNGKIREQSAQLYGEYGFSRKWTGSIALPVRRTSRTPIATSDPAKASLSGLGNTTLGIKRGFSAGGFQIAGMATLDLPATGGEKSGLATGFDAITFRPSVSVGKGLRRIYWYLYSGPGLRSDNYSAFVQTGGECGVHFGRIWGIVFSEWMQSIENGSRTDLPKALQSGLFVDRQSWWSYGLKMIIPTGRFTGFVLSAGGALQGKNVPNRPALSAGYYFKWE